jgi:hypothetical protein
MTLPADECLRRVLLHVVPRGFALRCRARASSACGARPRQHRRRFHQSAW